MGLLFANFHSQKYIEENYYLPFHLSEFWAVFIFTTLEAYILVITNTVELNSTLRAFLVFFNVVSTFSCALMFTLDPHTFEVPAHYFEYSLQILITCVNFFFISSTDTKYLYVQRSIAFGVLALSVMQICIYSGLVETGIEPERAAHFCEFSNEIFNGLFALGYSISIFQRFHNDVKMHYVEMHKLV
jgi:hypothetical protein